MLGLRCLEPDCNNYGGGLQPHGHEHAVFECKHGAAGFDLYCDHLLFLFDLSKACPILLDKASEASNASISTSLSSITDSATTRSLLKLSACAVASRSSEDSSSVRQVSASSTSSSKKTNGSGQRVVLVAQLAPQLFMFHRHRVPPHLIGGPLPGPWRLRCAWLY